MNTQQQSENPSRYRWYVLALLFIAFVFNFIDRHLVTILLEPIKQDLGLSDTQAGFMVGFAFAVFYTAMGVPIAWLADRFNRRSIIAVSMTVWSGLTALTGAVGSFWQMALVRMGVGVGEAGLTPAANSLIADYFPPNERARALGIYHSAAPLAIMLSALLGGFLEQRYGWRVAFVAIGLAGLPVIALVHLTLREPRRGRLDPVADQRSHQRSYTLHETLSYLMAMRSCLAFVPATALVAFVSAANNAWSPTFFLRSFGLDIMQMAVIVGSLAGIGGVLGMIGAGILTDKLASRDLRWYMRIPAITLLITFPFFVGVYFSTQLELAVALLIVPVVAGSMALPPVLAVLQRLVKSSMRAVAVAMFLLVINLVGMGLGPVVAGALSDWLHPLYGAESLRYALLILSPVLLMSAWLFWRAGDHIDGDIRRTELVPAVSAEAH